jgi:multimeric flavodoxin WrbA
MKVVAFNASPRPGGNSELLLEATLKPIAEAGHELTVFRLNHMRLKPCQDCGGCDTTGKCIINDDMAEIYDAIRSADRIVLASPIFFFALSAQAKIMIDRCQSFWCEKYLLKQPIEAGKFGRKGLLMLVGGMKKDIGVHCAEACAKAFFRTVSVPEHTTLQFLGVDAKGAILEHPTALHEAAEAGRKLITL